LDKNYMPKDIKADLQKILDYMEEAESTSYEEWFNDNAIIDAGDAQEPAEHIYESVLAVRSWLGEWIPKQK